MLLDAFFVRHGFRVSRGLAAQRPGNMHKTSLDHDCGPHVGGGSVDMEKPWVGWPFSIIRTVAR